MTIEELIKWAETKNCGPRRHTGSCEHAACDENDRAIAALKAAIEFRGTDKSGRSVSGWLIPD